MSHSHLPSMASADISGEKLAEDRIDFNWTPISPDQFPSMVPDINSSGAEINSSKTNIRNTSPDSTLTNSDLPTMSSNSKKGAVRTRQWRLKKDLTDALSNADLDDTDKISAIVNAVSTLSLKEKLKEILNIASLNRKKCGGKLTPLVTRILVWEQWHSSSITSTITNMPAQLKVSCKPKIQCHLAFHSIVKLTKNKRNIELYQNVWMVTTKTFGELHKEYNTFYPNNNVAYGTFVALKPFYIRAADEKEIAMCLCKIHLHMRRAIEGLVKLCVKQDINLPSDCYKSAVRLLQILFRTPPNKLYG